MDTAMAVRAMPWAEAAVNLDEPPTDIHDALRKSGLDWTVEQKQLAIVQEGSFDDDDEENVIVEPYPNTFANVRSNDGRPLGIVTKRYRPVQNSEAFEFLAELFGSEMHFETAGSLQNGRRVWVLMKVPNNVRIGGDEVAQYAFVSNSHDGKSSVIAAMTPTRILCANMLYAAVRNAKGGTAPRMISLRHTGDPLEKIANARDVLQVTIDYYSELVGFGNKLAQAKCSKQRAKKMIAQLVPIDDSMGERAIRNKEEARDRMIRLFELGSMDGEGDTRGNAPGTVWSWWNSVSEFADWGRDSRVAGGRWQRALDDPDGFKQRAWSMALEAANL